MSDLKRDVLIVPLAVVVTLGWIASLGYGMITSQFVPLSVVTPIMLILSGYVFGSSIINRGRDER